MQLRTCVTPEGKFKYAVHRPSYRVQNLRQKDQLQVLGRLPDGSPVDNQANFPAGEIQVEQASTVYEIPNALPFRGSTFIDASWAGPKAQDPAQIRIIPAPEVSLRTSLRPWLQGSAPEADLELYRALPAPVLLALATTSTDPQELSLLARLACEFSRLPDANTPGELAYAPDSQGRPKAVIQDKDLYEAVGNNPCLPDAYKEAMLLRPGAQGSSEIVGDYLHQEQGTHVYEYLRRNSYIPWGHFAANMGQDAVRYRIRDLSQADMQGLRHLYYQRSYIRLAAELELEVPGQAFKAQELEELRQKILEGIQSGQGQLRLDCALWGWNFGFDFSPTRYKLHGSHQQIHQQFALLPGRAEAMLGSQRQEDAAPAFACGDMVAEVVREYRQETGQDFFQDLLRCIRSNRRTDAGPGESSLVVYEDQEVMLFVPKAQVSQWELQLMPLRQVGNILEADSACRASLDKAMLLALRVLEGLGARMVTSIELSKRFTDQDSSQRLLYSFLPKLPWSGGSFSEAQYRFISGHFPEDFATACRRQLQQGGQ
ncbi:MAG: hypothetical protein ACLFMQ_01795 [Desulfohalobiaceae bacterium]